MVLRTQPRSVSARFWWWFQDAPAGDRADVSIVPVLGRILLQPPSSRRRLAPSPPQQEERVGERRPILLDAPLPIPLPARSSRGEGENDFRWWFQDAPPPSACTTNLPAPFKRFRTPRTPMRRPQSCAL